MSHDCKIGNNSILANGVQIAGHVTIEDYVIIGGLTPVHQFCIVGQHAMIGGGFRAVKMFRHIYLPQMNLWNLKDLILSDFAGAVSHMLILRL